MVRSFVELPAAIEAKEISFQAVKSLTEREGDGYTVSALPTENKCVKIGLSLDPAVWGPAPNGKTIMLHVIREGYDPIKVRLKRADKVGYSFAAIITPGRGFFRIRSECELVHTHSDKHRARHQTQRKLRFKRFSCDCTMIHPPYFVH